MSARVNFSMAGDVPLLLEYPIAPPDAKGDVEDLKIKSKLQFYLAPKIDDDTQAS